MDVNRFEERKRDHMRLALDASHQAEGRSGLDRLRLRHEALPEIDFDDVKVDGASLYIAGMTAGHPHASELNRTLARACANRGWSLGVGSQRRELVGGNDPLWTELKSRHPGLKLIG